MLQDMQPPDDIFFASLVLFDFVEIVVFLNLYNTVYIVRPSENRHQLSISFSHNRYRLFCRARNYVVLRYRQRKRILLKTESTFEKKCNYKNIIFHIILLYQYCFGVISYMKLQ